MFQHAKVPPHAGIKSQPTKLLQELEAANIQVPLAMKDFQALGAGNGQTRRIMVNNFSAAVSFDHALCHSTHVSPEVLLTKIQGWQHVLTTRRSTAPNRHQD